MNTLLLAMMLASGQPHGPVVHATDIKADFDDKLTDRFADALRKALPKAKHMRLEGGDDANDLYLTFLFPVADDGKHFSYSVDLMKSVPDLPPDRIASFTGNCRESEMGTCARDLIDKADHKAAED